MGCAMMLAICAGAAPNLIGPTGLLFTPTADALPANGYNVGAHLIEYVDDPSLAFNFGVRDNLEVGFARLANEGTIINAKYNFFPETEENVGLAVGVIDITNEQNLTLYGVASKRFRLHNLEGIGNFRAHLGLATGSEADPFIPLYRLFGGMNFDIGRNLTAMIEHDGNSFNYGIRGDLVPGLTATFGFAGGGNSVMVGGLSYNGNF